MMAGKKGPRQVIKLASAPLTAVLLPLRLGRISPLFGHLGGVAMRTPYALWPAQCPHRFVTFGLINQLLDIQHRSGVHRLAKAR